MFPHLEVYAHAPYRKRLEIYEKEKNRLLYSGISYAEYEKQLKELCKVLNM